jgi:chemotaxis protein MotB
MKKVIYVFCILLMASSCVSKKKWMFSEKGRLAALGRERLLNQNLDYLKAEVEAFRKQTKNLQDDTTRLGKSLREYQQALSSNISEQDKLTMLLQDKMSKLAEREATINGLQAEINAQQEKTAALLNSLKNALLGFNSDELTVTQKDGKIYVAMSDKLLFESGSAQVNKQGHTALGKLAGVLKKQTDVDVTIEGHTDSKPIKTARFKDNWDLGVVRATSVVRILTRDYGVDPLQILPAGRGEYMPIDSNENADGRARNRRTEIIITPRLEKLINILK